MRDPRLRLPVLLLSFLVLVLVPEAEGAASRLQRGGADGSPAPPARERPSHTIPRASSAIEIDGALDDGAWENALRIGLPWEVNPADNAPAGVPTEALFLYDDRNLYAAFRASDPDPSKIRARFTDRDTAFMDDFVGIVVDTFNDERRAFEFFVNPVGVQMDLVQDDLSGNEDASWDAIWRSAGKIHNGGYTVEMAIPFTSLRFQASQGAQTWGLDVVRIYPRDRRFQYTATPRDRNVSCYLCQISKITGFDGATPGRNLEITPTVTAVRSDARDEFPYGPMEEGDAETDLGLTVRWGITPNMTASGALNPDFSQVEADAAQLDVNEQFALFYPEKRPFFLEGADFFETPVTAVYTRTIADPEWGAKLTGKTGPHALGFFVAQDEITNLIFPASESSSGDSLNEESTTGVVRYRRDVGRNSAIGALVTARDGEDYHNVVVGADALLRPSPKDTFRLQSLWSQTRYPDAIASDFDQPEGDFSDPAHRFAYIHDTRDWGWWTRYSDLAPGFRADTGFVPQVNIRQPVLGAERRWIGAPGAWLSRAILGGDFDQTVDHEGSFIEREYETFLNLSGPLQSFLFLGGGYRQRGWLGERFDQGFAAAFLEIRPMRELGGWIEGSWSKRVDFAYTDPNGVDLPRQGDEYRITPSIRWEPGSHVRAVLRHENRTLRIQEGYLFRANLTELALTYQISLRQFVRAIVQYEDVNRNLALYPACAGPNTSNCTLVEESRGLFGQFLYSYKVNPQTAIYVGYTDTKEGYEDPSQGLETAELHRTGRTFFFKIGRAFVM